MSCGRRRPESCPARLRLVGWAAPGGAAHVFYRGYLGSYPLQPCCCARRARRFLLPTQPKGGLAWQFLLPTVVSSHGGAGRRGQREELPLPPCSPGCCTPTARGSSARPAAREERRCRGRGREDGEGGVESMTRGPHRALRWSKPFHIG